MPSLSFKAMQSIETKVFALASIAKPVFLMEDKTNVTMGPSSTLKLDRFVYAGPKKPGTIVVNLAQGTCRLVIGDANKRAYTIVTPTAAIGVRG